MKYYYHVTSKNNIKSILSQGLKCNEYSEIFLFENKSIVYNNIINTVANCIAYNQIFLEEYVIFEISSKGFNTQLIPDNVAECSAKLQWILKQEVIKPRYIKMFGTYKNNFIPFI